MFAVTDDNGSLCKNCCESERESIGTTTGSDGWCVTALATNWEDDSLFCSHCSNRIESAYAEDKVPTYVVNLLRFDQPAEKVETGLTLSKAKAMCNDPETSSETCTDPGMFAKWGPGPWFMAFTEE
jgi:hypothetical protein